MNITLVTTTSFCAPHFCCHPRLCNNLQADPYHSLTEIKRSSSSCLSMADFRQQQLRPGGQATAGILPGKGNPSTSQVLAAVTLLPVACTLLFLARLNLVGTLIGLAVATPLFVVFSPVLVPSALVIGLGVLGFLTSAAFGVTAFSSFSWMVNYIRSLIRGSCHGKWIEQNGGHRKWQEK